MRKKNDIICFIGDNGSHYFLRIYDNGLGNYGS